MSSTAARARTPLLERVGADERLALLRAARERGELPYFRTATSAVEPEMCIDGVTRLMMGSANYLGLATHPRVVAAARDAIDRYGTTSTGSRLLNGTLGLHDELEEELADWYGVEEAVVYTTGYQTNAGAVSALLEPEDTVVVDSAVHASLLDGCAMSGAKTRAFRHNRVDQLADTLDRAARRDEGAKLVIVDGVYSMTGDVAPLDDIVRLCEEHDVALMVDEAHSIGMLGERGTGAAELFGVADRVDVHMGAFSKAMGAVGGFIAGSHDLVDFLKVQSRALVFSTGGVPAQVAAALAAVRLRRSPEGAEIVARAHARARRLRSGLRELGFEVVDPGRTPDGAEAVTPIVPVVAGEMERAIAWWRALWDDGVYTAAAVHPAVPPSGALLRVCPTAAHTDEHIDRALAAFGRLRATQKGD